VGAKALLRSHRSPEAALDIASRFNGIAVPFAEMNAWIARGDIVITSTAAPTC